MNLHAHSDVASATFTLTSTPKTRNLSVKLQATGETSGLIVLMQVVVAGVVAETAKLRRRRIFSGFDDVKYFRIHEYLN